MLPENNVNCQVSRQIKSAVSSSAELWQEEEQKQHTHNVELMSSSGTKAFPSHPRTAAGQWWKKRKLSVYL